MFCPSNAVPVTLNVAPVPASTNETVPSSAFVITTVAAPTFATNLFASTAISTMLYYLLIKGELKTTRVAFSANKLLMKSIA